MHNAFAAQKPWDGVRVDDVPDSINSPDWMPWQFGHNAIAFVSFIKPSVPRLLAYDHLFRQTRKQDEEFGASK